MELNENWGTVIDRFREASENARPPRRLRDLLDSLDADAIEEQAGNIRGIAEALQSQAHELEAQATDVEDAANLLEQFQEALGVASDAASDWEEAENQGAKRDARELLLEALDNLVEAYDEIVADGTDIKIDNEHEDEELPDVAIDVMGPVADVYRAVLVERAPNGKLDHWTVAEGSDHVEVHRKAWRLAEIVGCPLSDVSQVPVGA